MPEPRRRGGAAAVLVNGTRIYVSHGNRGGHETANFSTSLAWLDFYDLETDAWVTGVLPDAPHPRDHTGGAYLPTTSQLCVAGGRDGGAIDFFDQVILPTDCFDLATETWTIAPDLPQGRAGAAYGTTCDGQYMIVAGGEGFGKAWKNVDVFNGQVWHSWDSLQIGRHGTGLAVDCSAMEYRDLIYSASGATSQGGGLEVRSMEVYRPNRTTGAP
jgi:hypothetical protein